jgi:hypothetical protein
MQGLKVHEKIKEMKEQLDKKEMEECTFKPKVRRSRSVRLRPPRHCLLTLPLSHWCMQASACSRKTADMQFDERAKFFQQQQEEKREKSRAAMEAVMKKEETFQPKIPARRRLVSYGSLQRAHLTRAQSDCVSIQSVFERLLPGPEERSFYREGVDPELCECTFKVQSLRSTWRALNASSYMLVRVPHCASHSQPFRSVLNPPPGAAKLLTSTSSLAFTTNE